MAGELCFLGVCVGLGGRLSISTVTAVSSVL